MAAATGAVCAECNALDVTGAGDLADARAFDSPAPIPSLLLMQPAAAPPAAGSDVCGLGPLGNGLNSGTVTRTKWSVAPLAGLPDLPAGPHPVVREVDAAVRQAHASLVGVLRA
jgi:hypothetical protein